MTEALCTPKSVRNQMAELIFECYDIPAVSFAVDSLAGFYGSVEKSVKNGLVIDSSNHTTNIIPILDSKPIWTLTRRIPIGSQHHISLMQKSM